MNGRIRRFSTQVRSNGSARSTKRPPDIQDRDVVDAIITEVEWEEEGIPEASLKGWWSDRWNTSADSLPARD
ncbi:MAG: hypothetical protein VB144_09070 [Clostridia bacterium]|nr:hypothetical protein [Clostridia bacterium]